jgi:hypothetical protein
MIKAERGEAKHQSSTSVPVVVDGYPTFESISETGATMKIKVDKDGYLQYIVRAESMTAPSFNEVSYSENISDIEANVEETATITGLSAGTAYKVYYILYDEDFEEVSEVMTSATFTTVAGSSDALAVSVEGYSVACQEGETGVLTSTVTGGKTPYVYQWTDASGKVLSTEANLSLTFTHSNTYTLNVTDATDASVSASTQIRVTGNQYVATFEDLGLAAESYWRGDGVNNTFFSGSFEFNNYYMASWDSWAYMGYSSVSSAKYVDDYDYTDDVNSAAGCGAQNSNTYGVAYESSWYGSTPDAVVTNNPAGEVIKGVWLTNTAWVKYAVLNGDGMTDGAFGKDDWFKVTITGTKADGTKSSIEYYLADYRAEKEVDRYVLDTWQWVDLSSLGAVTKITFSFDSTRSNAYGITTPTYVCFDNLGGDREVRESYAINVEKGSEAPTIDLASFFTFNPEDATVVYSIECDADNAVLVDGNKVQVNAPANTNFSLIAHAVQRGQNDYVEIPVSVTVASGVADNVYEDVNIYTSNGNAIVATSMEDYNISVYTADGRCVDELANCSGFTTLPLSSGVYIIRVNGRNEAKTVKVRL